MLFKNTIPALAGLVALAQGAAIAEPNVLDERQLICPAGYGPMGSAVVTTNIVITPVVINQFFQGNTVINIFGNTFNFGAGSVSTTVTVTNTVTTTSTAGAAVATPFILGVSAGGAVKRQTGPSYIGGGGSTTADCGSAAVWNIVNGQLSSGGLLVSTTAGTSFQPFAVSSSIGQISTTFSSSGNGLEWTNPAFQNGVAAFVSLNGVVEVVFNGSAPAGSTPVVLSLIPANACPAIASSSTTSPTSTSTPSVTTTTATPSASVTGAFNLQVQIPSGATKHKRQASTFIGAGGVITTDASAALSFFITNSQLFSNEGQYTTNSGVPFEAFAPLAGGSITTTFSAVGPLAWTNPAFTNGVASFCLLTSSNTIQFVFTSSPAGCLAVSLTPIPAGSAATSSSSSAPPTTSPPPFSSTQLPSTSSTFGPFTTGNTTTTIAPTGGLRRRY